ncbi:hypothetical protein BO94DRAFT_546496 [Aspergillus sclerotioniger CBS 115572]|uniref:Protein kinase domain-containing protein n=1 Tax=Aspergillus sclerotioniger CBS 115572 TaxID=1450535 RepID=A0A317WPT9_9EURO|nr:hypothetical protein BO94DRAFT_546496 [Aspergillus sclerotioniger CBS 115572]PWY87282.1 hypothetical protein BO94DRAFT_546496 [Aspergillus sclerotioniger CBS 115572]
MERSPTKEELLALLQEATSRAEQERSRAEEERSRAKQERNCAEQERNRAEQAETHIQNLTFAEYLRGTHDLISKPLAIQTNLALTTKGPITSPTGRICPEYLEPFDFREMYQDLFDEIYQIFQSPTPKRLFPPLIVLKDRGQRACDRVLASEDDLMKHQQDEVETPVKEIIDRLREIAPDRFPLGEGIMIENHSNTIIEDPETMKSARPTTDRHCVYHRTNDVRSLLYMIQYKAGHKLTDAFLRAGLRPMNMLEEVVQQIKISTDPDEKLRYQATYLSCAALTQHFQDMIKAGCEWGCVSNGHMKVILRIPEDRPETLQYSLLEPSRDAEPNPDDGLGFRYPYTAVGCMLGLTIIASRSMQRGQAWRNAATKTLSRWEVDFEHVLRSIPESERKASPPGSAYRGPKYPINPRSPYLTRQRRLILDGAPSLESNRSPSPDSSDNDTRRKHILSSPIEDRGKRQRKAPGQTFNYMFCTQSCLHGLSSQSEFDDNCPNVHLHQKHSSDHRHPLSRSTLVECIRHQLDRDIDSCYPLGQEGLHGSIFLISLQSYGYTLIGKGTEYLSTLEGSIYQKLESVQGRAVPVYLGDINLQNVYYLDSGREIIHMSLMAWGGEILQQADYISRGREIEYTQNEIQSLGVLHLDLHMPNMLWNAEVERVMFIDFSRAKIIEKNRKRKRSTSPSADESKRVDAHRHPLPIPRKVEPAE